MPILRNYHVFISHAWKYGDEYERLVNHLDAAPNFSYYNYSAPKEKPLDLSRVNKANIMAAIDEKIKCCSCVLVIAGMYASYREWMQYEIDAAKKMNKPIIAIRPFGAQLMPHVVAEAADVIVGWNTDKIVSEIRRLSI